MTQSKDFAWVIAFYNMADFEIVLISRIFGVFSSVFFFLQNDSKIFLEWILTCFSNFNFSPKVMILHGL